MYQKNFRHSGYQRYQRFHRPTRSFQRRGNAIDQSKFIKKGSGILSSVEYVPQISFSSLNIHPTLKENIAKKGYTQPTEIQDATIPQIMTGQDVVGIANTGTGKTAAFLIPLLNKLIQDSSKKVIIIVPTRELAMQIRDELNSLTFRLSIFSALCTGGTYIRNQITALQRRPHVVIGTPGRLKDLIERKVLRLDQFHGVVLDEVDRMLDMGFIQDIKYLFSLLPTDRQSLFFSATISPDIRMLINSFAKNPVFVSVAKQQTTENVDQDIVRVDRSSSKLETLIKLLRQDGFSKVLIFGRTKRGVEQLALSLYKQGFTVASIHGNKPQSKRNTAIRLFKENVVKVLVATDVASRGIDIDDISHVINFDQPATYEDYIHRIGRTGRGNKKGVALTFVEG